MGQGVCGVEHLGHAGNRVGGGENTGAAAGAFLVGICVGGGVGAEEIASVARGCRVDERFAVAFALGIATIPVVLLELRLTPFIVLDRMFQSYNSFILLAVPCFLLAANLMNSGKVTDRLIELARVLTGWMPGGLGHVNVAVSMLFAGISGSSTADAAGIGKILIPAMQKEGYATRFAVAITACSSVMGVIIPPSILMIVWGGVMQVSVGALFLGGAIPGLMIGLGNPHRKRHHRRILRIGPWHVRLSHGDAKGSWFHPL